ncbi:MAG: TnpV protein [Defluviitaleaceae bacterium]|nr:TnpV protein [Defluviitaleaceae bacterium]MCL2262854.1 TnpV protein [Defluviitaleaceae bacterium]
MQNEKPFAAMQFGNIELFKHCAEIDEQAEMRKRNMMTAIRKNPANRVTEADKATDPIAWAGRMGNFQAQIHETIYADLIYA